MVGFTLKGWGGAGESDRGAVFCRWPWSAGWKRATFQKLGETLHALAPVRWSRQQTLRNYYVADTGASNRNTTVSKPWSLASESLGNSKERIPTKNRRGKALRVQNDEQDQGRSPRPGNQRRIHKGSQTSPGGLLGETLSTWALERGRFSRTGMLAVMCVGYREKVQTQRQREEQEDVGKSIPRRGEKKSWRTWEGESRSGWLEHGVGSWGDSGQRQHRKGLFRPDSGFFTCFWGQ